MLQIQERGEYTPQLHKNPYADAQKSMLFMRDVLSRRAIGRTHAGELRSPQSLLLLLHQLDCPALGASAFLA